MTTPTAPAPAKKRGALFWVLISIAVFVLLVIAAVVGAGYYGLQMMKDKGIDAQFLKEHPNFAVAKMAVVMNPDAEIIEEDPDAGTIHYRSKKSGKEFLVTQDSATKTVMTQPYESKGVEPLKEQK